MKPHQALINYGADDILRFEGEYAFLSNFYPAPILWQGVLFPTVEHAYQASKSPNPTDAWLLRFAQLETPGQAKWWGRKGDVRTDWQEVREFIMLDLLRLKFQIPALRRSLLETGKCWLEEGNTWGDTFWGVCPPATGIGQNVLGKLLMTVRKELQGPR